MRAKIHQVAKGLVVWNQPDFPHFMSGQSYSENDASFARLD